MKLHDVGIQQASGGDTTHMVGALELTQRPNETALRRLDGNRQRNQQTLGWIAGEGRENGEWKGDAEGSSGESHRNGK
jgi:hypothetical protein